MSVAPDSDEALRSLLAEARERCVSNVLDLGGELVWFCDACGAAATAIQLIRHADHCFIARVNRALDNPRPGMLTSAPGPQREPQVPSHVDNDDSLRGPRQDERPHQSPGVPDGGWDGTLGCGTSAVPSSAARGRRQSTAAAAVGALRTSETQPSTNNTLEVGP
jgi:hypothetical protein